jgi:hypothetical protein
MEFTALSLSNTVVTLECPFSPFIGAAQFLFPNYPCALSHLSKFPCPGTYGTEIKWIGRVGAPPSRKREAPPAPELSDARPCRWCCDARYHAASAPSDVSSSAPGYAGPHGRHAHHAGPMDYNSTSSPLKKKTALHQGQVEA